MNYSQTVYYMKVYYYIIFIYEEAEGDISNYIVLVIKLISSSDLNQKVITL